MKENVFSQWVERYQPDPVLFVREVLGVDPPGFDDLELFDTGVRYVQSTKNDDMNEPGIRYYR